MVMIVDELIRNNEKAALLLSEIKNLPREQLTVENLLPLLRQVVQLKLMTTDDTVTDLKKLIIQSIRLQDIRMQNLSKELIQQQLQKQDCHRTSLIAHKKVLLVLFLEQELGVTLSDDEAVDAWTIEELAKVLVLHLKGEGIHGH